MIIGNGHSNGHYTPCTQCPLRRCGTLRQFTAEELAFMLEVKADELRVDPGISFLREGASSEHLYTVLTGWAFRYKMLAAVPIKQVLQFSDGHLPAPDGHSSRMDASFCRKVRRARTNSVSILDTVVSRMAAASALPSPSW